MKDVSNKHIMIYAVYLQTAGGQSIVGWYRGPWCRSGQEHCSFGDKISDDSRSPQGKTDLYCLPRSL